MTSDNDISAYLSHITNAVVSYYVDHSHISTNDKMHFVLCTNKLLQVKCTFSFNFDQINLHSDIQCIIFSKLHD